MTDCLPPPADADHPAAPPACEATAPTFAGRFFERTDWRAFGMATALLLAVYLWTLAPEVTLENSGTLATGAAYAGVPDSGGFPVWTIYSWLFIRLLPFSTIAWRVEVGSAIAAALAGGLVALMVSRGGKMLLENSPGFTRRSLAEQNLMRIVCGCVAGLALGFSGPVWQKAVIVDIWTFGMLLFTTVLCLLMRWLAAPEQRRYLYRAFLVFGMLLTGNWELILLLPALLLVVAIGDRKLGRDLFLGTLTVLFLGWFAIWLGFFAPLADGTPDPIDKWLGLIAFLPAAVASLVTIALRRRAASEWKAALRCITVFLLGLACFFYLPAASMMNPPVNWAYPRTVEGFFHCITRGQYEMLHPTGNLGQFSWQLWTVAEDTGKAFGWYFLPFALLPFFLLHRAPSNARKWMFGLTAIFLYVGPFLIAMLNPSAEKQSMELHQPYWSAMYVILAVWAGLGMMMLAASVTWLKDALHHRGPMAQTPDDVT
jgi:hypothetical protein